MKILQKSCTKKEKDSLININSIALSIFYNENPIGFLTYSKPVISALSHDPNNIVF